MNGKLTKKDRLFPGVLREEEPAIEVLYYEGDLNLLETRAVGVVGSRRCTQYGRIVAKNIGRRCAENGVTLISGLARGIDACGHRGVMEAGGRTIAVLGGGTEYYYPSENRKLQQQIGREGLLLSLHPPAYQPRPYDFPIRNRLISSLSESIIVVEAGNQSGALITAEDAAAKGHTVYAVPGNITSHYSFGTNKLIREKAEPLIFIDDIFFDMGINQTIKDDTYDRLSPLEKQIFDIVKKGGEVTVDEIHHKTNIKPSEINGIITILEMKGIIFSALGKIFVAKF